jgi:alcohol dehydrogenase class IV
MNLLNSFSFELPTKIKYGVGAAGGLVDVVANLKARNVLLITDKGVMRSGLMERITGPLEDHNLKWASRFGPDCLVALGGGSPIDCAKAIAVVARQGGAVRDL